MAVPGSRTRLWMGGSILPAAAEILRRYSKEAVAAEQDQLVEANSAPVSQGSVTP